MTTAGPWMGQPPPGSGGQPRPLPQRRVLDEQMRDSRRADPRPWGVWPWLGPVVVLLVLIVGGNLASRALIDRVAGTARLIVGVVFTFGVEALLVAGIVGFGWAIAGRAGGWARAFGLGWPDTGAQWAAFGLGLAGVYVGRTVVSVVANGLSDGAAGEQSRNLSITHVTALVVIVLGLVTVVIAPVTEELMFRGLLLRTFMRRMGFWPAATLSSGMFALFHVYEVHTLLGALTLAAVIFVLGAVNCYLVRITGRLAPGVLVHATTNALALLVIIATAGGNG